MKNALAALVHFMLIEQLELIDKDDGGMTILGNVLKDTQMGKSLLIKSPVGAEGLDFRCRFWKFGSPFWFF